MRDWVSPQECAERLRVDQNTVARWIRQGRVRAGRVGWRYRIPVTEMERLLMAAQPASPSQEVEGVA